MIKIAFVSLTLILAGCAPPFKLLSLDIAVQNAGKPPSVQEAKRIVEEYISKTFKDPNSVKDLRIKKPIQAHSADAFGNPRDVRWEICFEANAKNSYGGYTGLQTSVIPIRNGRIIPEHREYQAYTRTAFCEEADWVK